MTEETTRWHRPAVFLAWVVLLTFTAISAWYNREFVVSVTHGSVRDEVTHAGLPVTLLVAAVLAEFAIFAKAHGAARWAALGGLAVVGGITFVASYLGILAVLTSDPDTRAWALDAMDGVTGAVSAVPDVLMLTATVLLFSLRRKGEKAFVKPARKPAKTSRWSRLADAATARVEAAMAVPPEPAPTLRETSTETSVTEAENLHEPSTATSVTEEETLREPSVRDAENLRETSTEPSVTEGFPLRESSVESSVTDGFPLREPSPKPSVNRPSRTQKPSTKPSTKPFLEDAKRMLAEGVVSRKTPAEVAKIIAAIANGQTDNGIKSAGLGSAGTAKAVRAAWQERQPRLVEVS